MKKTLVALAIAGAFTGAAYAQSSVTIYGIVDGGVQVNDPKAGTTNNAGSISGVNGGIQSGNRLGFRGSEALGGGNNAIFTLENGYSVDDGSLGQSGRIFGRQAFLGLQNANYGTLVMGRTALFSSGTGSFDKFGSIADIGSTGFGAAGTQSVMTSSAALRVDNSIAYVSPKFYGMSAGYGHAFRWNGQELPGSSGGNNHADEAYIDYYNGPFSGVITYDRFSCRECTSAAAKSDHIEQHWQFAAKWDFGFMKLLGAYAYETNLVAGFGFGTGTYANTTQNSALQSSGTDANAFSVGVLFPYGAHSFGANYQQRKWDSNQYTPEAKRETWAIEYQYAFSTRTNLYAYYTEVSDKDAAKTANWGGLQQYAIGLRHLF
jgi:predicted porin